MLNRIPINPLSMRLMMVMVGLFAIAGSIVLLANLPGFYQQEVERRMRELVYIAELNTIEKQLGRKLTLSSRAVVSVLPSQQVRPAGLVIRLQRQKSRH